MSGHLLSSSAHLSMGNLPTACDYGEIISREKNLAGEGGRGGREGGIGIGFIFFGANIMGRWWSSVGRERRQILFTNG